MTLGHDFTAYVIAWAIFSLLYFWLPDYLVMFIYVLDYVNLTIIYCQSYCFSHLYIHVYFFFFWLYDFWPGFFFPLSIKAFYLVQIACSSHLVSVQEFLVSEL